MSIILDNNFNLFDRYYEALIKPDYYLSDIELEIAAILFEKKITLCIHDENNNVLERSFNENGIDHIIIFHSESHYERCIKDDEIIDQFSQLNIREKKQEKKQHKKMNIPFQ